MQDRLLKELRLAKISSIKAANQWLEESRFWEKLDEKFAVEAIDESDAHRPLLVRLNDVLCVKERRSVGLDGCVQWDARIFQLNQSGKLKRVQVFERWDQSIEILGDGRRLTWSEISKPMHQQQKLTNRQAKKRTIVNNKRHKPTKKQQFSLHLRGRSNEPDPALRKVSWQVTFSLRPNW